MLENEMRLNPQPRNLYFVWYKFLENLWILNLFDDIQVHIYDCSSKNRQYSLYPHNAVVVHKFYTEFSQVNNV